MKLPPLQTDGVERRELVVVLRDDRAEVLLHELGVLAKRGVHVAEDHAVALEILTVAVEYHFDFRTVR